MLTSVLFFALTILLSSAVLRVTRLLNRVAGGLSVLFGLKRI